MYPIDSGDRGGAFPNRTCVRRRRERFLHVGGELRFGLFRYRSELQDDHIADLYSCGFQELSAHRQPMAELAVGLECDLKRAVIECAGDRSSSASREPLAGFNGQDRERRTYVVFRGRRPLQSHLDSRRFVDVLHCCFACCRPDVRGSPWLRREESERSERGLQCVPGKR